MQGRGQSWSIQSQEAGAKLPVETHIVGAGEAAHLVEYLPGMMEPWVPAPALGKIKCGGTDEHEGQR